MHGKDYQLIAGHDLRNILRNCCNDPRDLPGRKQLRAELVEALPDAEPKAIDALMTKAEEFAKAAVDPGARWDLRARADALTLHVLKTYEAADRLVPIEDDPTPEEISAIVEGIDSDNPAEKTLNAIIESRKADELEGNRIRQMGGQS